MNIVTINGHHIVDINDEACERLCRWLTFNSDAVVSFGDIEVAPPVVVVPKAKRVVKSASKPGQVKRSTVKKAVKKAKKKSSTSAGR